MGKIVLGIVLFVLSIQDIRTKTVNVLWLIPVVVAAIGDMLIYRSMDFSSVAAGVFAGAVFILLSVITKECIGMGDALIFCISGMILGFWRNIVMIFAGMLIAAVFSLVGIVLKKFNKKSKIPLIPFVFTGYLTVWLVF